MKQTTMPAVVVHETEGRGAWNRLAVEEVPRPTPGPGEALIQVEACSVNRADLLQRRGLYPAPPGASPILGLDFAGYVVETAPDVEGCHIGERVFGVVSGGGHGRYAAVPAEHLIPLPENLSFVEGAAAAEVFLVAYLNLFLEARMEPGETLLLHGGGSGVGTATIQLARERDIAVLFTAGSDQKIRRCLELGASFGMNYKTEDFAARVMEFTGGDGIDTVLDWIGAPYLKQHLKLLKTRGRLVLIGLMGGHQGEIPLALLLTKRLRVMGSVLRSRSREEKAAIVDAFREEVLPMLVSGAVRPVVDRVYPIAAVEEAHEFMRGGGHFGKLVLTWQEEGAR